MLSSFTVVHRVLSLELPFALGDLQVAQELLLEVAQARGFLEVLALDNLVLGLLDLLDLCLQVEDLLRNVNVCQVHAGARLIQHVDGFVGQVPVGDIAIAQPDSSLRWPCSVKATP